MSEGLRDKFLSQASDAGVAKKANAELQMKVRETAKDVAILSMTAGEGSTLENNQQNVIINLADRQFYFDMELRTEQGKSVPSDVKLEVGKFYFVRVSVSLNPFVDSPSVEQNMLKQQAVIIDQKLDITLESSTLTMHGEIGQLELRCRRDWYIT